MRRHPAAQRAPILGIALALASACGGAPPPSVRSASLVDLRAESQGSHDRELLGLRTLAEMIAPGGKPEEAARARKQLSEGSSPGMWANLGSALYDDEHGDSLRAADEYVGALGAAASSDDPDAALVAWFAVRHVMALRARVADLFLTHRTSLEGLLARPGELGWRAVTELEEWRALEVYDKAERTGDGYDDEVTRRMGCAKAIRIAGPFGHAVSTDARRTFPAEDPLPWPQSWSADPVRGTTPRVLAVRQKRCLATVDEPVQEGVFYVEAFFQTDGEAEILAAVQGAVAVWIDGAEVLSRGIDEWGSWQRFGAHVRVAAGRHRLLARTITPAASVRLMHPDGTAAGLVTGGEPSVPTTLVPAAPLTDPNPIDAAVRGLVVGDLPLAGRAPITAVLAAYAAHADDADDVAAALLEPITSDPEAGAVALELSATAAAGDPALSEDARSTRSRALRERALVRDAGLWRARLAVILDSAEQRGLGEAIDPLRKLAEAVPGQPEVKEQLAALYGRLGWRGEQERELAALAQRFPDDVPALQAYLDVLDENGPPPKADEVAARIRKLDPDTEIDLTRSLARQDYPAALRELDRLKAAHPDRKDIAARTADVLSRAGDPGAAANALDKWLAEQPSDAQARFRLADHAYSKGDRSALRRALAAAIQVKASTAPLRAAVDLVEGATDLEPWRQDGRAIIREYQAWEKAGHHMDGTAARVLDYSAIWAHDDGSSEMLEHEIQKIQSQEAINAEAETPPPEGLVLHLRVLKPDGRVLEPEPVDGKATLTMPHLEVGDFLELEHVVSQSGDGAGGRRYESPHWFFREADKGYWRSEFVMITPSDRELEIEARGKVPEPSVTKLGTFTERRWRVDQSPPADVEPDSPPITEFLPSVRVGWGVSLESTLPRLAELAMDDTPLDPRLRTLAREIVRGTSEAATDERARRLYRYVLAQIQDGKETDGRRVLTGKTGSRQAAFRYLLRLLGIESELSLVKNRLSTPPLGKLSEIETYEALVLRVTTDRGARWMTVRDRFAPYGYIPSELRDEPAIRLVAGTPKDVAHAPGAVDRIVYEGSADMDETGSGRFDLTLTFEGNRAIAWRTALDQVPPAKLYDFVEKELIAASFDGAHVRDLSTEQQADLDRPLIMHVRVDVPELARPVTGGLTLRPPFAPNLAELATLPARRTPVLRRASWRAEIRVRVSLPEGTRPPSTLAQGQVREGKVGASVVVRDAVSGRALLFDRVIDLPSGRIYPGDEYAAWQRFAQQADALVTGDVLVGR